MAKRKFITVLDRIIILDLFNTLLAVLSTLVIIIVSKQFINILGKAIEGKVSGETIVSILGLKIISAAIVFLPVSLFVAVLMVLGRMYRDQEMAALASAGAGVGTLYRAVFTLVLPLSMLAFGLAMHVSPWAEKTVQDMLFEDQQTVELHGVAAGRFSEYQYGKLIFYVEEISADNIMQQVFLRDKLQGRHGIITADTGQFKVLTGGRYLVLRDGERVQGTPGDVNYVIEKFAEYAVRLEAKGRDVSLAREAVNSNLLWSSTDLPDIAELQRRFSIPIGILILSALAIPLAQISPRGGVYGNIATAFLLYFCYANLQKLGQSWIMNGVVPVWVGYSAIYFLAVLVVGLLLIKIYGLEWIRMNLQKKAV